MNKRKPRRGGDSPLVDPEFALGLEETANWGESSLWHDDHKARRLCRQVQRALHLALAERCSDPGLSELFVADITPLAGCGHLLVHIVVPDDRPTAEVLAGLRQVAPWLRSVVARCISRKRAPALSFVRVMPGGEGDV